MTLAEIIRAQLATGRPLRVTRALLEALDVETPLSADERVELNERRADDLAEGLGIARAWRERDEAQSNARAWADERDAMRRERDEARAEVERLRSTSWPAERRDIAIREAEERGARWALAKYDVHAKARDVASARSTDAARICEAARKAGEHE